MIRALILLILAACTTSKSAEQHAEVAQETHAEQQATQTLQQETHSEEGEWTRRTWEFGPPEGETRAEGRGALGTAYPPSAAVRPQDLPESNRATVKATASIPRPADAGHPSSLGWPSDGDIPLLRYTEETHAPAHVDTSTVAGATQQAKQDTSLQAHVEAQSASKTKWGLPWWVWAGAALALAAGLWLARGKLRLALAAVRALVG